MLFNLQPVLDLTMFLLYRYALCCLSFRDTQYFDYGHGAQTYKDDYGKLANVALPY